jgi:hypothetical protein
MARPEALPKQELYRRLDRFQQDDKSPVSWTMLAELTGYTKGYLRDVFVNKTQPLSETLQIRMSRALQMIENGDVTYMHNNDRTRFIKYNQIPKPTLMRHQRIAFDNGKFTVKLGVKKRHDYSYTTLIEELED